MRLLNNENATPYNKQVALIDRISKWVTPQVSVTLLWVVKKKTGPHSAAIKMLHRDDNNNARRYMVTTYLHGDCHQIAG